MARMAENGSDLANELQSLRDEVSRLGENFARNARHHAESAQANLSGAVDDLSRRGRDFAHTARERIEETSYDIEDHIARNPWTSILIASGVGLVLGLMTRQRD